MDKIVLEEFRYGSKTYQLASDDLIDRFNNRITVLLLMMCFAIVTVGLAVGKPINCWTPAEFKGQHEGYAQSVCWLKGSYYLPEEEISIPDRSKPRVHYVSYYQWTPFILLGMAMLFVAPRYLWEAFARQGGVNIPRVVKSVKTEVDVEKRVDQAHHSLKSYLDTQYAIHGTMCWGFRWANFTGGYTLMFFVSKVLYIVNTVVQFIILNSFLSFNFSGHKLELKKLFTDGNSLESPRFPRVTMCDFMIRHLGSNQHWYSVQCNLPFNMYNEKIFLGIWFWLLFLTVLNFLSIFMWITYLSKKRRLGIVKRYLKLSRLPPQSTEYEPSDSSTFRSPLFTADKFHQFQDYFTIDGFLIFEIIAKNTDDFAATQIMERLYRDFKPRTPHPTSDV